MRSAVLLVLMLAGAAGRLAAQHCFRPQPAPACASFWIVEVSSERRAGRLTGPRLEDWEVIASTALGGMANLSPRWALGGALVTVTRDDDGPGEDAAASHVGLVIRGRRWVGRGASVDLTAGLWRVRGAKPVVEAAVEVGGLFGIGVGARGDALWPRHGEVYVGVRYSSYLAFAAGFVALLTAAASLGGD